MPKFSAATVGRLEFDFTSFPRDDGEGQCSGKGFIPEPSSKQLKEFLAAIRELPKQIQDMLLNGEDVDEDTLEIAAAEADEKVHGILAAVCSGKPSEEQIAQLRPRIKFQFTQWLAGELNPKG